MGDASPRCHREIAELRARLSAAEQDARNGWKAFADAVKVVDEQKALVFAAEAHVEAAEEALAWYEGHKREGGSYDGDVFGDLNAIRAARQERRDSRAALAGREPPSDATCALITPTPDKHGFLTCHRCERVAPPWLLSSQCALAGREESE